MRFPNVGDVLCNIAAQLGITGCPACRDRRPVGLFLSQEEFDAWLASPEGDRSCPECGRDSGAFQAIIFEGEEDHGPPAPNSLAAALRPDLRPEDRL